MRNRTSCRSTSQRAAPRPPCPSSSSALAAHYGLPAPDRMLMHIMRLTPVDERILCDLDIDTRAVYMGPVKKGIRPCAEPGRVL